MLWKHGEKSINGDEGSLQKMVAVELDPSDRMKIPRRPWPFPSLFSFFHALATLCSNSVSSYVSL